MALEFLLYKSAGPQRTLPQGWEQFGSQVRPTRESRSRSCDTANYPKFDLPDLKLAYLEAELVAHRNIPLVTQQALAIACIFPRISNIGVNRIRAVNLVSDAS